MRELGVKSFVNFINLLYNMLAQGLTCIFGSSPFTRAIPAYFQYKGSLLLLIH